METITKIVGKKRKNEMENVVVDFWKVVCKIE